eukprot:TRINITY_DN6052_c0_g2_i1.p1 TRINITY_DN6052_c0_g2~~TRINITY_DN6052_c0_g2_i1.p1  ORF type:complete len:365 (-),score=92.29 TRINITY_DN6052_c0_g2_i1:686-1780(-)
MSGSEHFCLRWNDFETNISHAFQAIREEKDFFDVTIACEDEQVQAHKIILSACSPFFKKVLRKNPHQHPLLFLKGVKYAEIVSILNFMYHGEVNVTQDDLNGFLAVAEELKVKGLTQNDQNNSGERSKPPPKPSREPPDIKESPPIKRARVQQQRNDDIQEITVPIPVKTEPVSEAVTQSQSNASAAEYSNEDATPFANTNTMVVESHEEESYDQGYDYGYEEETPQFESSQGSLNTSRPDGNKDTNTITNTQDPEELIYFDRDPTPGSKKNWRCKLCGEYAHNRGNAMNHVEAKHLNVNYNCDHCTKSFRSRNSMKTHVSTYHSASAPGSSPVAYNQPKLQGHQSFSTSPNKFKQDYYSEPYL